MSAERPALEQTGNAVDGGHRNMGAIQILSARPFVWEPFEKLVPRRRIATAPRRMQLHLLQIGACGAKGIAPPSISAHAPTRSSAAPLLCSSYSPTVSAADTTTLGT